LCVYACLYLCVASAHGVGPAKPFGFQVAPIHLTGVRVIVGDEDQRSRVHFVQCSRTVNGTCAANGRASLPARWATVRDHGDFAGRQPTGRSTSTKSASRV